MKNNKKNSLFAKAISIIVTSVMLFSCFTFSAIAEEKTHDTGDVNLDGAVDTRDSLKIVKSLVGIVTLTPQEAKMANCNGDDKVDTRDSLKILKVLVGLDAFECDAKLASTFNNNMVLQRGEDVAVWGYAENGKKVTVSFANQTKTTIATNGRWIVKLDSMEANKKPQPLFVKCGGTKEIKNVLVGEVWLASGQSNMAFMIDYLSGPLKADITKDCTYPDVRIFTQDEVMSDTEQQFTKNGKWSQSSLQTVGKFSTHAFLLARDLYKELDVPIGVLVAAFGGTRVEQHVNSQTLADSAIPVIDKFTTNCYNSMLAPIMPYTIKGAIWYQGEGNVNPSSHAGYYSDYLKLYVNQIRAGFNNPNLPFIQVQLPSFDEPTCDFTDMRYYQMQCDEEIENVFTVPAYDTGAAKDIHPSDKGPIAKRIRATALNKAYGKTDIDCQYPKASEIKVSESSVTVSFNTNGIKLLKNEPNSLYVCGTNGLYYQAKAEVVEGSKLKITSDDVRDEICGVKYASKNFVKSGDITTASGNLIMPFRWENLPELEKTTLLPNSEYDIKTISTFEKYSNKFEFKFNQGYCSWPSPDNGGIHKVGPVALTGGANDSKCLPITIDGNVKDSYMVIATNTNLGDNMGAARANEVWYWIDTTGMVLDDLWFGARAGGLYGTHYGTNSEKEVAGRNIFIQDGKGSWKNVELSTDGTLKNFGDYKGYVRVPIELVVDESAQHEVIKTQHMDTFTIGMAVNNEQNGKVFKVDDVMLAGPALEKSTGKVADYLK